MLYIFVIIRPKIDHLFSATFTYLKYELDKMSPVPQQSRCLVKPAKSKEMYPSAKSKEMQSLQILLRSQINQNPESFHSLLNVAMRFYFLFITKNRRLYIQDKKKKKRFYIVLQDLSALIMQKRNLDNLINVVLILYQMFIKCL